MGQGGVSGLNHQRNFNVQRGLHGQYTQQNLFDGGAPGDRMPRLGNEGCPRLVKRQRGFQVSRGYGLAEQNIALFWGGCRGPVLIDSLSTLSMLEAQTNPEGERYWESSQGQKGDWSSVCIPSLSLLSVSAVSDPKDPKIPPQIAPPVPPRTPAISTPKECPSLSLNARSIMFITRSLDPHFPYG